MDNLAEFINQCVNNIAGKFTDDPFKYFNEKDLHFELQEQFKMKYPSGPYYIHREYPVPVKDFEYGKGKEKRRKTAAIDIVATSFDNSMSETPLFGVEMFLGKFNDEGLITVGPREYFLTKSNLTAEKAREHLEDDYWKLKRTTPSSYLLVYFLTHVFTGRTPGRRRERISRISWITDALRSHTEVDQNRLVIIETIYENGVKTNRQELGIPTLKSNIPLI